MDKWLWAVPAAFVMILIFGPFIYYVICGANEEDGDGDRAKGGKVR